jgi:hypothetical protein
MGALSGITIAVVSEVAKRSPAFGALIVSLRLVSLLGILWLWRDTGDAERIASHDESTFWYVLPSLPMLLVLPTMHRAGVGFWPSMGMSCALTVILYFITAWSLAKFRRRNSLDEAGLTIVDNRALGFRDLHFVSRERSRLILSAIVMRSRSE